MRLDRLPDTFIRTATAAFASAAVLVGVCAARAATPAQPCQSGPDRQRVTIALAIPESQAVVSAVLSVTYDPALLRLPETGGGTAVRTRLKASPGGAMLTPNNEGDALRIVAAKGGGLSVGPLAAVEFDRCAGARSPQPADLRCQVASCAGAGGPVDGCTCTVTLP